VTDRVRVTLTAEPAIRAAVETHRELILAETVAAELTVADGGELRVLVEKTSA
jgi:isoleucyl-tRNA synthetase